jgi:hypothetical protein
MNDLQTLRTVLSRPDPPHDVVDRGRRRLQGAMRKPAQRHRPARLAAGIGMTTAAAAIAVAVALASGPAAPGRPRPSAGSSPNVTKESGRAILLAAATTAASRPQGSGRFWHIREIQVLSGASGSIDEWYKPDGQSWFLDPQGTGVYREGGCNGPCWRFAGTYMTFGQLQRLPTSPPALKAWIARSIERAFGLSGSAVNGQVAVQLAYLLWFDPVPPAVRAAAFRALALLPDVKHLGAGDGGQVLLITGLNGLASNRPDATMRLVVNPATAQVRSVTDSSQGTQTILAAGWTNRMPPVVKQPPPGAPSPVGGGH